MNEDPAAKAKRRKQLLAACEAARQRCNRFSAEENRKLLEDGLRIIYSSGAKARC